MKTIKKVIEIKEVRKYLVEKTGEFGQKIILIYSKTNRPVKDEYLAKKLNKKVTDIRSALNTLHYLGVSQYQKEKNQNTGWYSFTWKLNEKRLIELIKNDFTEKINELKEKEQKNETYTMFGCPKRCEAIPFEVSAEYQFICPNCGNHMNVLDSKKVLRKIRKEKKQLEKTLKKLEEITKTKNTKNRTNKGVKKQKEKKDKQGLKTKTRENKVQKSKKKKEKTRNVEKNKEKVLNKT